MILLIAALRAAVCSPEASARAAVPGSRARRLVERRMAELIVHFSLFFITQDCVSLCNFFKLLFCICIARIGIRVIFLCKFSISFFNLCFICISADPEHFIVISLL